MLKIFFFLFLFLFFPFHYTWANGSPFDESVFGKSGEIKLIGIANIRLGKEVLDIRIKGRYIQVDVVYTLRNLSEEADISYAFPIDMLGGKLISIENDTIYANSLPDKRFFNKNKYHWKDFLEKNENDIIKYFKILDNDKPLKYQVEREKWKRELKNNDTTEVIKYRKSMSNRFWYICKLNFKKEEIKTLKVSFQVEASYEDWITSKDFCPRYSMRSFSYDFSPASNWGDGQVQDFELNFHTTLPEKLFKTSLKLNQIQAGKWQYKAQSLKFADLALFEVSYNWGAYLMSDFLKKNRLDPKLIKSITASSELAPNKDIAYTASNAFDGKFETAWIEGNSGYGEGEWIEITFVKPVCIMGIAIYNGYAGRTSKQSIFEANSRIKSCFLISNNREYFGTHSSDIKTEKEAREYALTSLEPKEYIPIDQNNFAGMLDIIYSTSNDFGKTYYKSIRIKVHEVHKGTKYADTGISEIFIVTCPDRK